MKARDMEVRPTRDRSTRVRRTAVAHDTKVRDMRDHDTEARMAMEPLVLVLLATPKHCPMQVPSRHLAVTVLPTSLPRLRKQSLRSRGQRRRSIVCRTLQFLRITTLRLNKRSRPREHSRRFQRSARHSRVRGRLLMPPLRSLRSLLLDVVLKHPRHHLMCLEDHRMPLAPLLAFLYPALLLLDVATKTSKTMDLETPRQSFRTIASAVSI
jgi:hypothetical protein